MNRAGEIDFSDVTTVNLDEYYPISPENDQSYRYFMNENLFSHVNVDLSRTFVPDGAATDPDEACRRYEEILASVGQVDIQVLGIGQNGHIGFNEPDVCFSRGTHQVTLTESTIAANTRFFESVEQVPRQAYSVGMQAIMQAKKILLIASGADKAEALQKSFFGPVTPQVPASILQLHQDVTVIADMDALALCPAE